MSSDLVVGWTVYRLPRSHWHCTLHNFNWEETRPKDIRNQLAGWFAKTLTREAPHLLLTGAPGIGKTHLGVAMYRQATAEFGTVHATWVNVPEFCEAVKGSYTSRTSGDVWEDVEDARRVVVLDDLFGRELTNHEASQVVYRLLDTAYRNGAALIATMNQSVEELRAKLPAHEMSRLLASCAIIPMRSDKDWRL